MYQFDAFSRYMLLELEETQKKMESQKNEIVLTDKQKGVKAEKIRNSVSRIGDGLQILCHYLRLNYVQGLVVAPVGDKLG